MRRFGPARLHPELTIRVIRPILTLLATPLKINVADAKREFSRLLGRVAFAGETIVILRRGRPMAKLVPADTGDGGHLADVVGWLDDDDPFFKALDEVATARATHRPRAMATVASRRKPRK